MSNWFKYPPPLEKPEGCSRCGCKLSRVRWVSSRWINLFLIGRLPQWVWDLVPSRCRRCGHAEKEPLPFNLR